MVCKLSSFMIYVVGIVKRLHYTSSRLFYFCDCSTSSFPNRDFQIVAFGLQFFFVFVFTLSMLAEPHRKHEQNHQRGTSEGRQIKSVQLLPKEEFSCKYLSLMSSLENDDKNSRVEVLFFFIISWGSRCPRMIFF